MSYVKTNWINNVTEVDETNMNHIEDGIEANDIALSNLSTVASTGDYDDLSNKPIISYPTKLLAVSSTAPSQCVEGDMYFNTTTNLIYTATGTNTWGSTGTTPSDDLFYVVFGTDDVTIYVYNGTTLVGVSGGGQVTGGENIPVGVMLAYAGSTAPEGYVMCNQTLLKSQYPELYNVIGGTYGETSTTFNTPNVEGKVLVMLDTSQTEFDTLGETGGEKTHTLTIDEIPSHSHTIGFNLEGVSGGTTGNNLFGKQNVGSNWTTNSQSSGNGQAHNILQPYIVVNYIIKAHPSAVNTSEVVNEHSTSETNVYSANYVNNAIKSVYSTSEVKTNKVWIDGKPIYRKIFTFSSLSNSTDNLLGTISNVDYIISMIGTANIGGIIETLPHSDHQNIEWDMGLLFNTNDNKLYVRKGGFGTITGSSSVIVEYTKSN